MKLTIAREELTKAMKAAAMIAPARGARPILACACITEISGNSGVVLASNIEQSLRYELKIESVAGEPMPLCVRAATLAGLLAECSDDFVTLETKGVGENGVIIFASGRDRFEINRHDAADFPEVLKAPELTSFTLPAATLETLVSRTVFAAARESGRYAINGLYMVAEKGWLEMVATDGRRLALAKCAVDRKSEIVGSILPLAVTNFLRAKFFGAEEVRVCVGESVVFFQAGAVTISTLLVNGIYPKYGQIIPKDGDKEANFTREDLIHALIRASFLISEETNSVRLVFSENACQLESRSPDKGSATVVISCDYKNVPTSITFQLKYLQEVLRVLDGETVRVEMSSAARPGVVRDGTDFLYVIMPVNAQA